jgi:hypothetical protein
MTITHVIHAVLHGNWPTVKMWLALYAVWAVVLGFCIYLTVQS